MGRPGGDERDEWYVTQARAGRLDAFEELVRRHQVRAFRVAMRLVPDHDDAADVVQDSFIQAWRALPSFRGDSSFGTWLYRLVVRRARRRRTVPIPTDVLPQLGSGDAGPAEQTEAQHMLKAAEQALGGLNAEQRVPLLLHAVEGFSYQEVADMLGVSVSAVKSRIYRARLDVLAALQEWT